MKTDAFNFFNKNYLVDEYTELYKKIRLDLRYPANVKRLEIAINLLKKYKPKKIVDAGCGAGMPLIDIKKRGEMLLKGNVCACRMKKIRSKNRYTYLDT